MRVQIPPLVQILGMLWHLIRMQRVATHAEETTSSLKRSKTINADKKSRQEEGARIINMAFANVAVAA